MMAQARKYAELPDLDSAPEVYQTPDLAEDVSTLPTSTARSVSSYSEDSDGANESIDRRHVIADEARSHFSSSRKNARSHDFPDGFNTQRKIYKNSRRRRRGGDVDDPELTETSDEEEETLDGKLARLRREIEEARLDLEKRKASQDQVTPKPNAEGSTDIEKGVEKLGEMLDAVYTQRQGGLKGAEAQFTRSISRPRKLALAGPSEAQVIPSENMTPPQQLPEPTQSLAKAAELDARLSAIEKALGISGANMPDIADQPPKPILQTLENLDRQISILNAASTSSLDAATRRVRQLTQEAERAQELRSAAQQGERETSSKDSYVRHGGEDTAALEYDPKKITKINALYGALQTIDSLAPSLPLVLERLRTLRLIHASAGTASATLDQVERQQAEQEAEIKRWKEALEKAEAKMAEGEEVLKGNVQTVGGWVRDLEARVEKLT